MSREERTTLVTLLDDLKDRQKASKVPQVFSPEIKRIHTLLKQLYKKATLIKWKQDMMIKGTDVVMPTFLSQVDDDVV